MNARTTLATLLLVPMVLVPFLGAAQERYMTVTWVLDTSANAATVAGETARTETIEGFNGLGVVQFFNVVVTANGKAAQWRDQPASGNGRNADEAREWLVARPTGGQAAHAEALRLALQAQPQGVYFYAAAPVDEAVLRVADELNAGRQTTIHTVLIGTDDRASGQVLQLLAAASDGTYRHLP